MNKISAFAGWVSAKVGQAIKLVRESRFVQVGVAGGTALLLSPPAQAAFVTADVDGDLTFAPLEIVIKLINAAVSGAEAAVPLVVLGGGIYLIMKMFGLVGGVRKR